MINIVAKQTTNKDTTTNKNVAVSSTPTKNLTKNLSWNLPKISSSYCPNISFKSSKKPISKEILNLNIPNLRFINDNCVRGESLSSKRNKHKLEVLKNFGLEQVIDLRTSDHSDKFRDYVEHNGVKYSHFPIDAEVMSTREIIDFLPDFFNAINKGNFYIACAQGLHRTDIALAINYLFNEKAEEPPILYGHQTTKGVRVDDIFQRTNAIFKNLNEEDRNKLNLNDYDETAYKDKKTKLMEINNIYNKKFIQK